MKKVPLGEYDDNYSLKILTKPYFKHRLGEKANYYEVLNSLPINLAKTGAVQAECMKQFINAMKTE